jgi:hypothetical protein
VKVIDLSPVTVFLQSFTLFSGHYISPASTLPLVTTFP